MRSAKGAASSAWATQLKARFTSERNRLFIDSAFSACYSCDQNPGALPQAKVEIAPLALNVSNRHVLNARKRHSLAFNALPVRRKIFPLGQSLNTSHRLQSGLRA